MWDGIWILDVRSVEEEEEQEEEMECHNVFEFSHEIIVVVSVTLDKD